MSRFFKILFSNLVILLAVVIISEFVFYQIARKQYYDFVPKVTNGKKNIFPYFIETGSAEKHITWLVTHCARPPVGLNYKKKSIVLFGCSYTFGSGLEDNQTFSAKLSKYTKRPVFNRGFFGKGLQLMYWQLNSDLFYKDITVPPEYMIYVFSYDMHMPRLYLYTFQLFNNYLNLRYYPNKLDENGDLVEIHPLLPQYLNGLYTVRYFENAIARLNILNPRNTRKHEEFIRLIFNKSKKKAQAHYPDVKFVVFCIDTHKNESDEHQRLLDELKDDGFIVVKMNEITDIDLSETKWHISDGDEHPNEMFWDNVVPKLAQKLKL